MVNPGPGAASREIAQDPPVQAAAPAAGEPDDSFRPGAYAWVALALLTLTYAFNFVDRQLLSILAEHIIADLHVSDSQIGLLTGAAFGIFYGLCGIPLARLADRWSSRNVLALSLTLWSGMTAFSGAAQTFLHLAIARTGVAVGESGCVPTSHALLSRLFPRLWRGRVMSIHSLGMPIGILGGLSLGGWLAEHFGWRTAFIAMGAPGLLLALVLVTFLRRDSAAVRAAAPQQRLGTVLRHLLGNRTILFVCVGSGFNSIANGATLQWTPAFFMRSFGMGTAEVGLYLGIVIGLAGAAGTFIGGALSDHLGKRDARWYLWLPTITVVGSVPLYALSYMSSSPGLALTIFVAPIVLTYMYLGPVFATIQTAAPVHMRATAGAILMFLINVVGGLGPLAVGIISDTLKPSLGPDGLRYALVCVVAVKLVGASFYWRAARTLPEARHAA